MSLRTKVSICIVYTILRPASYADHPIQLPKISTVNIIHRIEDHYTSVIIYVHVHWESQSRGSVAPGLAAPGPAREAGYLPLSMGPIHLLVVVAVEERLVPRRRQSAIDRLG